MKAERVRAALQPNTVLDAFGVGYARRGTELRTQQCPTCGQRSRDSVCIAADTGAWQDKAHGCAGDIFALVAGYAGLDIKRDFPRVVEVAASIAGIMCEHDPDLERRITARREAEAMRARAADAERSAARARMREQWQALDLRSLAGERYLQGRCIDPRALRQRGDVVRFIDEETAQRTRDCDAGEPAVSVRDLATGAIVGVQRRRLGTSADPKIKSLFGSSLSRAALFGRLDDIERSNVAVIVEGLADTLCACLAWPDAAVFGAPGVQQLEGIAAAVAPRVKARGGLLLIVPDDDEAGIEHSARAAIAAQRAGLVLGRDVVLVDLGSHHDLADAYRAGWRWDSQRMGGCA